MLIADDHKFGREVMASHDPDASGNSQILIKDSEFIDVHVPTLICYRYLPRLVNMAQSPFSSGFTPKISDNLTRAAGVLQDMQVLGQFKSKDHLDMPGSPGPPALFGAGGPM
jgi:hypothetical protein